MSRLGYRALFVVACARSFAEIFRVGGERPEWMGHGEAIAARRENRGRASNGDSRDLLLLRWGAKDRLARARS